ncbi:histone-lysine N-methyltransferase SETMAR [Trichonephila clavipes]|nr:histone-lysine N-methyltransferase SETMAR [Trichonephila clavipes]
MATVDFLHHENPPTWAGVKPEPWVQKVKELYMNPITTVRIYQQRQNRTRDDSTLEVANYVQFWFRRFRSGIFGVKDAPRTGGPIVKNVDKITEIIEADQHVSSRSIVQELKIDHKTF